MKELLDTQHAKQEVQQRMEILESQFTQFKIEHMTLKESYDKLLESEKNFKELNEKYRQSFIVNGGQELDNQIAAGSTKSESQAKQASQLSTYKD